jgi:intracellular sulfur oxidation DsrE/DsrF family protein
MTIEKTTHRRRFLGSALAAAAAATLPFKTLRARTPASQQAGPDDWLNEVQGEHRCLFDFNEHKNGVPLLHMLNYLTTYSAAYGTQAGQVGAVGTLYGFSSIAMGFDDEAWEMYRLGELVGVNDADGRPYTRNVFHRPTTADGHVLAQGMGIEPREAFNEAMVAIGIENLQKMGTKFLMCNNALNAWSGEIALQRQGDAGEINETLRAHLLPGVTIVPAMVIAIEKAQREGIAYNKQ